MVATSLPPSEVGEQQHMSYMLPPFHIVYPSNNGGIFFLWQSHPPPSLLMTQLLTMLTQLLPMHCVPSIAIDTVMLSISVLIDLDFLCWRIDKDAQKQSFLIQTDLLGISAR